MNNKKTKKENKKDKKKKPLKKKKTIEVKKTQIKKPALIKNKPVFAEKAKKEKEEKPKNSLPSVHKTRIRIIGIGGGAETILSEIYLKVKNVDFVSTDTRSVKNNHSKLKKIYFGEEKTHGLGTGMNPELGELSAESDKNKIEDIFLGQDICILVSCLGGGAGSGAMPVFAKIAKNINVITYGVFTLPFNFEGEKKKEHAFNSIEKAKPYLNSYCLIPNEKIFEIIDKKTPIKEALSTVNKKLAQNLEGFIEMIFSPGLINIDFADFKTILNGKGRLSFLNTAEINKINLEEDVKKIISDPFSSYNAYGSKSILFNISGGEDLELREVALISKTISNFANKKVKIIFGINQNKKNKGKIKTTILAVGCEEKKPILKKESKAGEGEIEEKKVNNKTKKKIKNRKKDIKIESEEKEKKYSEEDFFETPAILRKFNDIN